MKRTLFTNKAALLAAFAATVAAVIAIPIATGGSSADEEGHVNPTATGPEALISSGAAAGIRWALYAYESDRGLCFEQRYTGAVTSTSQTCGAFPRGRAALAVIDRFGPRGEAAGQFVYGPARAGVARVVVELASGESVGARPVAAPAALGRIAFYVAAAPASTDIAAVRSTDRSGRVLETMALFEEQAALCRSSSTARGARTRVDPSGDLDERRTRPPSVRAPDSEASSRCRCCGRPERTCRPNRPNDRPPEA